MYTQEQILDMYFDRNQQAVSATSQMYGAKLTRFADTMVAHEDALECVNDTYIAAWNKIPPERPMRFLSWLYRVCRNIVCDRIDWNNASKRNSNMNCMLDELEECLADSNAKYEGELSDIGRCLSQSGCNRFSKKTTLLPEVHALCSSRNTLGSVRICHLLSDQSRILRDSYGRKLHPCR